MSKRDGKGWQEQMVWSLQRSRRGFGEGEKELSSKRARIGMRVLWGGFLVLLAVVVARVIYLQVFERGQNILLAASNHLEQIRKVAPRGIIYDRNGEALVANVETENGFTRDYILGPMTAPILGYISEVREEELGCSEGICYAPGMWVGRTGVEKTFESTLKGRDGGRLVEVDARGEEVRELGSNEAEQGHDLKLTIDARLQKLMAEAIGDKTGSIVAIDMKGQVLGLVSNPSYDPNLFTIKSEPEELSRLLTDDLKMYFLDRPISGVYPPGSVFKLVTALSGLDSGEIDESTLIEDTGEIRINQYRYGNWYFDQYGRKEGEINVVRALARSNDIFFYKVGEMVGVDTLGEYARKLGYGELSGIELPGEVEGLVPTRLWKERSTGEKWFLGNTYHMAIGQGDLQVTPVQVARASAAAVSGRKCKLTLEMGKEPECEDLGIPGEYHEIVREGMKEACQTGGTAFPFFDFSPYVLCKTGTAQHAGQQTESDLPHAWIVTVYPGENPEMVMVVMLDSAGEGSAEAGPLARQILEKWRDMGN